MSTERIAALLAAEADPAPPPGYVLIGDRGGFDLMFGPLYGRMENGALVIGFRCTNRHLNGRSVCHGGMIATVADMAVYAVRVDAGAITTSLVTVSLTNEFLRPVALGDWVEVRTTTTKSGRSLHFAQMIGTVGTRQVFQTSGVFANGGEDPEGAVSLAAVLGMNA